MQPDFPDSTANTRELGWLDGWRRSRAGFELMAYLKRGGTWERTPVPANWLHNTRAFEPAALGVNRRDSRSFQLSVPDLSELSPLLNPGQVARFLVPAARGTGQAIFAAMDNEQRAIYLPASLLLRELWLWSASVLKALLTPGSLSVFLEPVLEERGLLVKVRGPLAEAKQSDTALRRLTWLAQSAEARSSWSSVLTFAHGGELNLRLPRCSLNAWVWGVESPSGTIAAELSAVHLEFDMVSDSCELMLGAARRRCPPKSRRAGGFVSF